MQSYDVKRPFATILNELTRNAQNLLRNVQYMVLFSFFEYRLDTKGGQYYFLMNTIVFISFFSEYSISTVKLFLLFTYFLTVTFSTQCPPFCLSSFYYRHQLLYMSGL